jgi:hypothetical protein
MEERLGWSTHTKLCLWRNSKKLISRCDLSRSECRRSVAVNEGNVTTWSIKMGLEDVYLTEVIENRVTAVVCGCQLLLGGSHDSGSARRKTSTSTGQHNTERREQTSMPWPGFRPTIPVSKRLRPTPWTARPLRSTWTKSLVDNLNNVNCLKVGKHLTRIIIVQFVDIAGSLTSLAATGALWQWPQPSNLPYSSLAHFTSVQRIHFFVCRCEINGKRKTVFYANFLTKTWRIAVHL